MLKIGHRGAPYDHRYQENTIASFRRAYLSGADAIELDVRLTKDGIPVVFHDENLKELTGLDKKVSECEYWGEISKLKVHGEPILLLTDVFKSPFFDFRLINVELKCKGSGKKVELVVKSHINYRGHVMVSSFDPDELASCDQYPKALLIDEKNLRDRSWNMICKTAKDLECAAINPDWRILNKEKIGLTVYQAVETAHLNGLLVYPWVVNSAEKIKDLKEARVEGIISDFPAIL